jgi:hypothetical protein
MISYKNCWHAYLFLPHPNQKCSLGANPRILNQNATKKKENKKIQILKVNNIRGGAGGPKILEMGGETKSRARSCL